MRIFQFIIIVIISIAFTGIVHGQSSVVLESTQLKEGQKCILFSVVNGALTKEDTILIKSSGRCELSPKTPFTQGQYFLETPKKVHNGIIEFLIENSPGDMLTISADTIYNTVLFKDNQINGVYSAYLGSVRSTEDQIQKLYKKGISLNIGTKEKEKINEEIKGKQKRLYDLETNLVKRYSNTLLSAIIQCNSMSLMPGSVFDNYMADPTLINYKETTTFLCENYWKGVDFKSDILIHTTLLPSKTKKYISLFDKNDPNLSNVVKELLDKSTANPLVYQVISNALYDCFNKSVYSDNYENIVVDILKNAQGQPFIPDWKKQSIEQQIIVHQKNIVGSKATNLTLSDATDVKHILNDQKSKYTILFFYDPECSHCIEIMPKMKGWFYVDGPRDAEVLAIYINQNEETWRKYLKENTYPPRWLNIWDKNGEEKVQERYWIQNLPAIYVLDENKNVVLKNASFQQLVMYFNRNIAD